MNFKKILQLQEPDSGEPICSGSELTIGKANSLAMAHFHTVVTIKNARPRNWLGALGPTAPALALDCAVAINGKQYEQQQFTVSPDEIGKTLFCAGFPCITITGVDVDSGEITVTLSEIVDLRESDD